MIVYSRWDRSPDILEDQVTYPIVSAMLGAPKVKDVRGFQRFRVLVRVHHFRGGHGHLLGALADAGVPLEDTAAAAEGRADGTRAGCDGRGLGVSVCAGGRRRQQPGRAAQRCRTGSCAITCRPCREWRKWRRWAGSCGSTR